MHNPAILFPLAIVLACIAALGILALRANRRARRPGLCPSCNLHPISQGETECEDCSDRGVW